MKHPLTSFGCLYCRWARLVEQLTVNQKDVSSNLTAAANILSTMIWQTNRLVPVVRHKATLKPASPAARAMHPVGVLRHLLSARSIKPVGDRIPFAHSVPSRVCWCFCPAVIRQFAVQSNRRVLNYAHTERQHRRVTDRRVIKSRRDGLKGRGSGKVRVLCVQQTTAGDTLTR